jgi:transposase
VLERNQHQTLKGDPNNMVDFIFGGCDLHEETLVNRIAVGPQRSERKTFANTAAGRENLIRTLKEKSKQNGGAPIVFGYEASGQGFVLYDQLTAAGIECYVLAPTKMESSVKHQRNKNDDRDAERILKRLRAYKLAGEELPSVWVPDMQTRDDRETVRARQDLSDKLASVKTQLGCLLRRHGIEKPIQAGRPWTKAHRQWLDQLSQKASQGIGVRTALTSLLRQIGHLESEIHQLDEAVEQLSRQPHRQALVDALDQETGIGRLTATAYVVEIADFTRFRRGRQVGAYWGLTPSSDESGEVNDRKGHITRQGSPRIRKLLCQATWYRTQKDPEVREVYQRLISRNPKKKRIAVVACMRRLAVRLWHVGKQTQLKMKEVREKTTAAL